MVERTETMTEKSEVLSRSTRSLRRSGHLLGYSASEMWARATEICARGRPSLRHMTSRIWRLTASLSAAEILLGTTRSSCVHRHRERNRRKRAQAGEAADLVPLAGHKVLQRHASDLLELRIRPLVDDLQQDGRETRLDLEALESFLGCRRASA